jgi:hypothetical protein
VKGAKQLDEGIGDTFVSGARRGVSFALIGFQDQLDAESLMPEAQRHCGRYESVGDTIVQLRGPFCSG